MFSFLKREKAAQDIQDKKGRVALLEGLVRLYRDSHELGIINKTMRSNILDAIDRELQKL